jgi:two-component system response regulator AtoC
MREVFELVERVSRTEATVLLRGESGTGKELVARALHALSPRREGPFRARNCATLSPELAASELFGHEKGAFTGAQTAREGLFASAEGGSVFLDEIAELSLDNQARLLRVVEEREFVAVGATEPVRVDVRLISATNKSLRNAVNQGSFREDLMYRVRVVPIFLPPLVERDGDLECLSWHFINHFNARGHRRVDRISKEVTDAMHAYPWPGNVRELRNAIEHAFALGVGPELSLDELPPELRGEAPRVARAAGSRQPTEKDRISEALATHGGRKSNAAEALGMSRTTLWRKMREHGLLD